MITARTNAAPGTAPGPGGCGGAAAGRGSPRSAGSGRVPVAGGWGSRVCAVCVQRGAPSRCSPTLPYPGFPQKDLSGVAVLSTCKKSDGFLSNAAIQPLVLPKQLSRNAQGRGVRRWHCHITACVSSRAPSHPDEQTSLRAWPLSQGLPLPEK